jgi:MerR family transcriptional regulator, redox-sensitive transcriptional activator SoxR
MMEQLSIGEVARRAGLRPSALRYYERIGLLPQPARVNGRRRYDPQVVGQLAVLRFAQRAGFTLAEMRRMFRVVGVAAPREAWQPLGMAKLRELEARVEQLQHMRRLLQRALVCECVDLAHCELVRA